MITWLIPSSGIDGAAVERLGWYRKYIGGVVHAHGAGKSLQYLEGQPADLLLRLRKFLRNQAAVGDDKISAAKLYRLVIRSCQRCE